MTKPLTQDQAAALRGVTARRLRQLDSEDNPPPKDENGQYDPGEFGRWLRAGDKAADYFAERARLTKEQADKAEMENDRARGLLMGRDEVAGEWSRIVMNFKTRLLSIPSKLAPLIFGMKSIPEVMVALKAAIYEALNDLSAELAVEGDPAAGGSKRKRVGGRKPKAKPGGKCGAGKVEK